MSIFFAVQGVVGRPEWPLTKQCIEASDIGTDYHYFRQLPGEPVRDYFFRMLQAMQDSGCELCVRFEDDLSGVNRHIKHNVQKWPNLRDRKFGAGWLLAPGGIRGIRDQWHGGILHMAQGVVLKGKDLPEITKYVRTYWDENPVGFTPDLALSYAAMRMGRKVCIHNPSLVRHNETGESLLGNAHHPQHDSDCESFKLDWRRRA